LALAENQKLTITVLVVIVLVVGLSYLVFSARSEYVEITDNNQKMRAKINRIRTEKVAKIPGKMRDLKGLREREVVYRRMAPPGKDDNRFFDYIEECRKRTKVVIETIDEKKHRASRARGRSKSAGIQKYTFEIKMIASFDQFLTFVNLLETTHADDDDYMRFVRVDGYKVEKMDDEENVKNLNEVDLTVSIMSYQEPERARATGKPAPGAKSAGRAG